MHAEYRCLLQRSEADPEARVIVVTGDLDNGALCAGADARALTEKRRSAFR